MVSNNYGNIDCCLTKVLILFQWLFWPANQTRLIMAARYWGRHALAARGVGVNISTEQGELV